MGKYSEYQPAGCLGVSFIVTITPVTQLELPGLVFGTVSLPVTRRAVTKVISGFGLP